MMDRTRGAAVPALMGGGAVAGWLTGFAYGPAVGVTFFTVGTLVATLIGLLNHLEVRDRERSARQLAEAAINKGVSLDVSCVEPTSRFDIHVASTRRSEGVADG